MPAIQKRRSRGDYTDHEIDVGLTAFALCSGHRDRAARLLAEQGIVVPAKTIWSWARKYHADRYEHIRHEVAPKLQEQLADAHQALAGDAADLEGQAIARLQKRLASGDVEDKDLANIFKNAAIAGGVHVDKAQLLNNRPTSIVQRDLPEVLRALKAKGIAIEGEVVAEEDVEAIAAP